MPRLRRNIRRVVCVQQIQFCPAYLHLPGANPELRTREVDRQTQPFPVCLTQGLDRQLTRIIEWIKGLLLPLRVDFLPKISLLIQQTHTDYGDSKIAGRLELIASDVSKPS